MRGRPTRQQGGRGSAPSRRESPAAGPASCRHGDRLLLIGVGIGTAPILALLQELPETIDVAAILRASTPAELVLLDEVASEVRRRGGHLVELVGSRQEVRLDAGALREIVPDVRRREVYLCGPDALSRQLASELERAGVPEPRIHFESFTF